MKVLIGAQQTAFLVFFVSHIPFTILLDSQAFFSIYFPQFLRDFNSWYCDLLSDILMRYPSPPWFQALVLTELTFQLPFFFVAYHMFTTYPKKTNGVPEEEQHYPRWFQTLCIIYGTLVSTTMVPIFASFWTTDQMTTMEITITTAIYSPYLFFPLGILYLAAKDDFAEVLENPTPSSSSSSIKKD